MDDGRRRFEAQVLPHLDAAYRFARWLARSSDDADDLARDKDRTKTSEDRLIELCPRALEVLKRQLALRARFKLAGKLNHEQLFFKHNGEPIRMSATP